MSDSRRTRLDSILRSGEWSDQDMAWLLGELNGPDGSWVIDVLGQKFSQKDPLREGGEWGNAEEVLRVLHSRMRMEEGRRAANRPRWLVGSMAAAASLAIGIFLAIELTTGKVESASPEKTFSNHLSASDPYPGYDKAVLILPEGRTFELGTTVSGEAAMLADSLSIQMSNGLIGYGKVDGSLSPEGGQVPSHTVMTPRAGQYRLILADGTKVWLNSASSIRYPAVFNGTERRVRVTGEAYFEVAPDKVKPFRVEVDGRGVVEVLGTRFNVNAYPEESHLGVTLLEGSVRFGTSEESEPVRMLPGQQLRLYQDGGTRMLTGVETAAVVAWKDGKFDFGEGMDISEAMRQISRWYDVDIRYEGRVAGKVGGSISRRVRLSRVLEMIELTGLATFSIQEGVLTVAKPKG
jgi:ferric-dicitrate binding protein FerR (iron transport regulator)